jgi:mono/diheme cytochrome c family protein
MTEGLTRALGVNGIAALLMGLALTACGDGRSSATDTMVARTTPAAAAPSGADVYQRCATCHQPDGQGLAGTYPPLAESELATAENPIIPALILINGLQGPVTVRGQDFDGAMPPYGVGIEMSDAEVAAVLTYVRSSWGNRASAVSAEDVAEARSFPRTRDGPVTAEELNALEQ